MEEPRTDQELVTIEEGATRLGISERTMWEVVRRNDVPRFRLTGRGRTTFVRWLDLEQAYHTPRPIHRPAGDGDREKKCAA